MGVLGVRHAALAVLAVCVLVWGLAPGSLGATAARESATAVAPAAEGKRVTDWAAVILAALALVISVVAWPVGLHLTVKAQGRHFHDQILNTARLQITGAIREYQQWLWSLDACRVMLGIEVEGGRLTSDVAARNVQELHDLCVDPKAAGWCFQLEEHLIVFPEVARALVGLLAQDDEIARAAQELATELGIALGLEPALGAARAAAALRAFAAHVTAMRHQSHLVWRLRDWLQNRCLGHITGNSLEERPLPDPSFPTLVEGEGGMLAIVPGAPPVGDVGRRDDGP